MKKFAKIFQNQWKNIKKNKKKIILFSNDPGGAQVLSSYFFFHKNKNIYLCSSRSTEKFFKEKKIKFKKYPLKSS